MRYEYNVDLKSQHVHLGDRLATYWFPDGSGAMIIQEEADGSDAFVVASFDCYGHCNNATMEQTQNKAWKTLLRILQLQGVILS